MGEALLAGEKFIIDPHTISWDFNAKARDVPTLGGKVVQVFGTTIGDMTLEGQFGRGGHAQQEAFLRRMKNLGAQQAADMMVSNATAQPWKFIYPSRGWDFMVYLKAYENPDGGRSVTYRHDLSDLKWRLVLFIVENNTDLVTLASNSYIARLSKGLGWRQSEYNGGYGMTDSQTVIQQGLQSGGSGGGGGGTGGALTGNFPANVLRWKELVAQFFPPEVVNEALAIINCESGGNPNAVNPRNMGASLGGNAKGLFQHMDGFWAERSRSAGYAGASIFNPEANIATGAWLYNTTGKNWSHWVCAKKVGLA